MKSILGIMGRVVTLFVNCDVSLEKEPRNDEKVAQTLELQCELFAVNYY